MSREKDKRAESVERAGKKGERCRKRERGRVRMVKERREEIEIAEMN